MNNKDCDSGQEGNNAKGDGSEKSGEHHKNPYYDRFIAWIEPYLPPPVTENSKTAKRRKRFQEYQKLFIELSGFLLAAIGGVIVIAQLIFTGCQLHTMQAQTTAMQEQLTEMQKTRTGDERAWVFTELRDNCLVWGGTDYVFNVIFKNTGKTAAFITGDVLGAALDVNQIPAKDNEVTGGQAVVPPNSILQQPMPVPPLVIAYTGKSPIYIYGTIWYKDVSGGKHWTQFCFSILNKGENVNQVYAHSLIDDIDATNNQPN